MFNLTVLSICVNCKHWISSQQHHVFCTVLPRLATKVTIAGGALYVACDSGLLGSSEQGSQALEKVKAALPPAIEEWMKYFGVEVFLYYVAENKFID